MKVFENVLETIGNTPMIRLHKVCDEIAATVYAKVETYNPGHSIKDRMALKMLEVAEKEGKIKPGGTIIEGTSGNTGMGLALAACVKGYNCIFTTTDKQSKEKADILVVTIDDKNIEKKKAFCEENNAKLIVLDKSLDFKPISTTEIRERILGK